MIQYYRTRHFNYALIDSLESIFERKQSILSEKMEQKIEKLFCLVYKIQRIYDVGALDNESEEENKRVLLKQLIEFNKLFASSKKKKSISLCV